MESLVSLSCQEVRKNWHMHQVGKDDPLYNIILEDWFDKFGNDKHDDYVKILVDFALNNPLTVKRHMKDVIKQPDDNKIIIKGLCASSRQFYHEFCNELGLWHESKTNKKRWLYCYKPTVFKR